MGLNSNLVSLINNLSDFNLSNHQAKFIEHYNIIFSDSFEIFIYRFIDIPSKKYPDKNVRAFEIQYVFEIYPQSSIVKRIFHEEKQIHKRHRLGNNLYVECDFMDQTAIYIGHIPFSKIGQGVKEVWELLNDEWVLIDKKQTWIS